MFRNLLSRTTIANVVAGVILLVAAIYAATSDAQMLRDLSLIAAGYLLGRAGVVKSEH